MEVIREQDQREEAILNVAAEMMTAARTAPKGKGEDNLVIALLRKDAIREVSDRLREMGSRENGPGFFLRDAENILDAPAMVVFGTRIEPMKVAPCGMCGFSNCDEKSKSPDHPCAFNTGDLGIAIGSAVAVAMDRRVDNRIMFSVGQALLEMGTLGNDVKIIYGVPLSVSGKNPFFDRKSKKPESVD